jgi:serine phosphatase RsbU (regulator of sigma subunit)/anti-sigma regulatory factor (Ser/Thr protein kinase)/tetratricopeptide (TPR) repeat protein/transposase
MFKRVIREECKVPADINYLGEMRDFITRVGRKFGVSERIINAFKLAIDEAATNIIRHAYRDWDGFITIRMIVRNKNVTVSLIDQGHTFDLRKVRDPDLQRYVEIGKKGGLGIFIIRRVIDNIDYRKTVEGNELRLTKTRDVSPKRSILVSDISLTLKVRFSLIASGILTIIVCVGFLSTYSHQGKKILKENLDAGRALVRSITHQSIDPLAKEEIWELARIAAEAHRDHAPNVDEILILDTQNIIQGALHTELILERFRMPSNAVKIRKGIFLYKQINGQEVYDLVESAIPEGLDIPIQIGTVHLLLDKSIIDREITGARRRTVIIYFIILLIGYLGIFTLVYVTMSPFKKLAKWVKALGRDEAHDEMEFDTSSEIGEIAQAFNEITEKFRKSQENLAEQERLQKEMQVAQEIQHTLLPAAFPEVEGYEIASYYEAAKEVGGDYFDFVEVDKDTMGIVVADVSGKGVPGSLVMTMIRTALRTEARGNKNAADVLSRVNDFVMNDMKRGMFVTVFYIILDSHNRTISYASAGHNPMILFRGQTKRSYYLNPRGFPIGINLPDKTLFSKSIQSETLQLREGDVLIIYTDGITEAMNPHRDRFGEERFLSAIRKYGDLKVDPLVDKIKNDITVFTEGFAQSDDITLVAIREKLKAEDVLFNLRSKLIKMVNEEGITVKEACETVGVSTSTYYKYKKRFEKMGSEGLKEQVIRSEIEEKHISIEDTAKIYDIIKEHPEYGAKRIHEVLNTEKYGFTVIDEKRLYEELVRTHLNTKELRQAFVEKKKMGMKMKPPGTPLLTLDGQVIVESKERKAPFIPEDKSVGTEEPDKGETESDKKPGFKLHVSQHPEEEIYQDVEDVMSEDSSILDDFLDFADQPFEEEFDQENEPGTDIITAADFEFESISENEKSSQIKPDTEKERQTSEDEKESLDEELIEDDLIDAILTDAADLSEESSKKQKENSKRPTLEEILKTDESELFDGEEKDQIESHISTSAAGDLFDEEIGIQKLTPSTQEREGKNEEGFIEMIEGLGFDRRSVLYTDKTEGSKKTALKGDLNKGEYLDTGMWFYQQGQYKKAINEFKKAMELDPNYIEAYQCLGDTFFRLGQLENAMQAYEKVRKLDPDNLNVLENLGVIFANRGDYKKAVWQWGEVLKKNPERKDIIERIKRMQRVIRQRSL